MLDTGSDDFRVIRHGADILELKPWPNTTWADIDDIFAEVKEILAKEPDTIFKILHNTSLLGAFIDPAAQKRVRQHMDELVDRVSLQASVVPESRPRRITKLMLLLTWRRDYRVFASPEEALRWLGSQL